MTLSLRTTLDESSLAKCVTAQLNAIHPDGNVVKADSIRQLLPAVLRRVEHCFTRVNNKYFFDGMSAVFDHLHSDQYAMFLYLLSREAYGQGADGRLAEKVFLLNKALHGIDAYYEVELPSVFLFVHPLATVLGRGRYADHLVVYQRCGVGSNHDVYPKLGEFVTLRPGSAVLGRSQIGRNCTIATESLVLDFDVPDNTIYIGNPQTYTTRPADGLLAIWRTSRS